MSSYGGPLASGVRGISIVQSYRRTEYFVLRIVLYLLSKLDYDK
jgi:hypothetical protein